MFQAFVCGCFSHPNSFYSKIKVVFLFPSTEEDSKLQSEDYLLDAITNKLQNQTDLEMYSLVLNDKNSVVKMINI